MNARRRYSDSLLRERAAAAFREVADAQSDHLRAADPVRRFLDLILAALASGRAHVAGPDGDEPDTPGGWGWRERIIGTGDYQRTEWQPQGDRIGWVTGDDKLCLEPAAAYRVAQAMAGPSGEGIAVTERTLWRRMRERGLLCVVEEGRSTVQLHFEGQKRRVLRLTHSLSYAPDAGISGTTGTAPADMAGNGDSVPDMGLPLADFGDTNGDGRGQKRGLSPLSPKSPLVEGERGVEIPAGWTVERWVAELRRKADRCEADHSDRAEELRERAAIMEVEAEQEAAARTAVEGEAI